ncbi:SDR family NAD(P)-dependent oxidoreductase [Tomitella biformata]|uniref:SDR family NAD(P)-dependent oxidoreductase n=1 Tax=Tomitella biformata TaxID=630403 RepID=UPI000464C9A8|nr:SDR family NAD(P)-dependent oxidoreductase [Tomitella biformata]
MSRHRFDDRVAIVTGAGRGIGRAHASLLAELGAKVVVNDLGGSKEGFGADSTPAQEAVEEIRAAGGVAVADFNNVGTPEGCQALVQTAIEEFGRIDIVVNNAGISEFKGPLDADAANLDRTLAVHIGGSYFTTLAAWPHMVAQGYGRIVMTASHGMLGLADNLAYATAKGGIVGMARSLTVAAADQDIKINVLAPAASTRRGEGKASIEALGQQTSGPLDSELVGPMMAYLAHEDCPVRGGIFGAGAGRFTRLFIAETPGYLHTGDARPTVEDVAANWDQINDEAGYIVPTSLVDWSAHFMAHLRTNPQQSQDGGVR